MNQVYADVLNKRSSSRQNPNRLGSGIFAMLAAGAFPTIEAAQTKLCPQFTVFTPRAERSRSTKSSTRFIAKRTSHSDETDRPGTLADILPELRKTASQVRATAHY